MRVRVMVMARVRVMVRVRVRVMIWVRVCANARWALACCNTPPG